MKVWVVWASNGESYEDNYQDIWAICSSRESAERCIAVDNVREQIRKDNKRYDELLAIINEDERFYPGEIKQEMDEIYSRLYSIPESGRRGLPNFSIREYNLID